VAEKDPLEFELFYENLQGASQAFKLGATDGQPYAVKFREKAENELLGLARELLAAHLAESLGVQVPEGRVMRLTQEYLDLESRLSFGDGTRPAPGLCSGSLFLPPANNLPPDHAARLASCPPSDPAGVLVFNTWVGCGDRSWNNYAFTIDASGPRFASIDYAASFARAEGAALQVHDSVEVVDAARAAWHEVDAVILRVEEHDDVLLARAIAEIPGEFWTDDERDAVARMLQRSRQMIRSALDGVKP
jgi:hypothetical protein